MRCLACNSLIDDETVLDDLLEFCNPCFKEYLNAKDFDDKYSKDEDDLFNDDFGDI